MRMSARVELMSVFSQETRQGRRDRWVRSRSALDRGPEYRGVTSDLASAGCLMSDETKFQAEQSEADPWQSPLSRRPALNLDAAERWNETSDSDIISAGRRKGVKEDTQRKDDRSVGPGSIKCSVRSRNEIKVSHAREMQRHHHSLRLPCLAKPNHHLRKDPHARSPSCPWRARHQVP